MILATLTRWLNGHPNGDRANASEHSNALVLADSVRTGFSMLFSVVTAQTLTWFIMVFIAGKDAPRSVILIWSVYHFGSLLISLAVRHHVQKTPITEITAPRAARALTTISVVRSASWTLAAIMFMPYLDFGGRAVFLALMCAMTVGATMSSIAYFPAFIVFLAGALLPVSFMFIFQPDARSQMMGYALFIGFALILQAAWRLNQWLRDSSARKFELEASAVEIESNRVEAENARRESERLREQAERASHDKTRFLAAASHDLRQPMHSLMLFLEAARERNQDQTVGGLLEKVDQSVHALDALFESLLDVSRLDSGGVTVRRSRFALAPLLQGLEARFGEVARQKGIQLRVRPTTQWALSDPALLERIVSNLVSNAIRYTASGGVLIGVRSHAGRVRIEVWDTGEGIPESKHQEVFQEFVQLSNPERDRRKGLGLGLAIVERLSKMLDHPIVLRSQPRRGSMFSVSVPLVRAPANAAVAPRVLPETGDLRFSHPLRVLLIDDEVETLEATMMALELMGCEVYPSAVAQDALATLSKLMSTARAPDVIVSDYRLGTNDQNGLDLIERLRALASQRIPAALLTGDAALFDAFGARSDAPKDVALVSKPATSAQLSAVLHRLTAIETNTP